MMRQPVLENQHKNRARRPLAVWPTRGDRPHTSESLCCAGHTQQATAISAWYGPELISWVYLPKCSFIWKTKQWPRRHLHVYLRGISSMRGARAGTREGVCMAAHLCGLRLQDQLHNVNCNKGSGATGEGW